MSIVGENSFEDENEKDSNNIDAKLKVFSDLGFPPNITYGNRSSVRGEFMRFLRLAYLLDFIAVQALGKLFITNIESFKENLI